MSFESNPRRSLVMLAAGCIAGLLLAGYSLFTAKGTATRSVPPEDVALVNQRPILRSDFIAQVESMYTSPFEETTYEQRHKVLDDMIREELYVQRGLELDFPASDPDTRSALVAAVEQQVIADVTTQQVGEADLRRWYEQHRDDYSDIGSMDVRDWVYVGRDVEQAHRAVAALRAAADPGTALLQAGYRDSGKLKESEFYFAARIHLGAAAFEVARRLASGALSDPFEIDGRLHVLQMIHNTPPKPRSFELSRDQVEGDYKRAAAQRLQSADEAYLREKADLLLAAPYASR